MPTFETRLPSMTKWLLKLFLFYAAAISVLLELKNVLGEDSGGTHLDLFLSMQIGFLLVNSRFRRLSLNGNSRCAKTLLPVIFAIPLGFGVISWALLNLGAFDIVLLEAFLILVVLYEHFENALSPRTTDRIGKSTRASRRLD